MIDIDNATRLTQRVKAIRTYCLNNISALIRKNRWNIQKDIRVTSFQRLIRMLAGLNVSFIYALDANQDETLYKMKIMFHEENIPLEKYLIANEIFLKLGFTSSLYFIIEGVLKVYLQSLDENKKTEGIKNICKKLLSEKLKLEEADYYINAFDFLRLIRNTLHSNGIHNPTNKSDQNISSITYKEKIYKFEQNKRIDFVTWDLLFDITDDMRNLLFLLANNELINKSNELIIDPLAI